MQNLIIIRYAADEIKRQKTKTIILVCGATPAMRLAWQQRILHATQQPLSDTRLCMCDGPTVHEPFHRQTLDYIGRPYLSQVAVGATFLYHAVKEKCGQSISRWLVTTAKTTSYWQHT